MKKPGLSWWQWVLMYPTLAVAALASLPTLQRVYQSYAYGVPFGEVDAATTQNELWTKNAGCLGGQKIEQERKLYHYSVSVLLCPSGDVLVLVKGQSREIARWVSPQVLMEKTSLGYFALAFAAPSFQVAQGPIILCQTQRDGFRVLRINVGGRCFDDYFNPFTGQLVKRVPVPCSSRCA